MTLSLGATRRAATPLLFLFAVAALIHVLCQVEAARSIQCIDGSVPRTSEAVWPGEPLPACPRHSGDSDESDETDETDNNVTVGIVDGVDGSTRVHARPRSAIKIRDAALFGSTDNTAANEDGTGFDDTTMFNDFRIDFSEPVIDPVNLGFMVTIRAPAVDAQDYTKSIPIVSIGQPSATIAKGMCTSLAPDENGFFPAFETLRTTNVEKWKALSCTDRRTASRPNTDFNSPAFRSLHPYGVYLPLNTDLFPGNAVIDEGSKDCGEPHVAPTTAQIAESDFWYDHFTYTLNTTLDYINKTCKTPNQNNDAELEPVMVPKISSVPLSSDMLSAQTVTYEFSVSYMAFTRATTIMSDWRKYVISVSPVGSFSFASHSPNPAHAQLIGLESETCPQNNPDSWPACTYSTTGKFKRMVLRYSLTYSGVQDGFSVGPQSVENILIPADNCYAYKVVDVTSYPRRTQVEINSQHSVWTFTVVTQGFDTTDSLNEDGTIFQKKCLTARTDLQNQFNFDIKLYRCGATRDGKSTLRAFQSNTGDWQDCSLLTGDDFERVKSTVLYKVYHEATQTITYDMVGELLYNRSFAIDFEQDAKEVNNVMDAATSAAANSRMIISKSMHLVQDVKYGASSPVGTVPMLPLKPVLACYINNTQVLAGSTKLDFLPDYFHVKEVRYTGTGDVYPAPPGDADLSFHYGALPSVITPFDTNGDELPANRFNKERIFFKPPRRLVVESETDLTTQPVACGTKKACDAAALDLTKIVQALHSVAHDQPGVYSTGAATRVITALEFSFSCLYMLPGIDEHMFTPAPLPLTPSVASNNDANRRRLLGVTPTPITTNAANTVPPNYPQTSAFVAQLGVNVSLSAAGFSDAQINMNMNADVEGSAVSDAELDRRDWRRKYDHEDFWRAVYIVPVCVVFVLGILFCLYRIGWLSRCLRSEYVKVNGVDKAQTPDEAGEGHGTVAGVPGAAKVNGR